MNRKEEIFPLVDVDGNIIGSATRKQCHDGSKLLHPVIHLHVFNTKGELFLQKRSPYKDIEPDKWDSSVGGHIDLGEIPEDAAKREAREEIGLTDISIHYIKKYVIETNIERELTYCFYTVSDNKLQIDQDEVSEGRFWALNEISTSLGKNIFTPNFELDFKNFLHQGVKHLISIS